MISEEAVAVLVEIAKAAENGDLDNVAVAATYSDSSAKTAFSGDVTALLGMVETQAMRLRKLAYDVMFPGAT